MTDDMPGSARDEVTQLRNRIDELSDPVRPVVDNVTNQARQYAQQTQAAVAERTDEASEIIRRSPFTAVLIACAAGYLIGRIVR